MSDGIARQFQLTLIGHPTLSDLRLPALHTLDEAVRIGVAAKGFGFTNVHMILADKIALTVPLQEKKGAKR